MKKNNLNNVKVLTFAALLTALSVCVGILCKNFLTFSLYYRITFENFPVILAGVLFGPLVGVITAVAADTISCLCSTNPNINPIITLGAACVGFLSGISMRLPMFKSDIAKYAFAVISSHLLGQVVIKSIGKILFFGMPWWGVFIGLVFSVIVGFIEFFTIRLIMEKVKPLDFFEGKRK